MMHRQFRRTSVLICSLTFLLFSTAFLPSATCLVANGADKKEKDSVERDYSKELPRIAPKEPDEALKTFQVAPGFKIQQVASEPLVSDPVAMAFDEDGRLFVVEMRGYSEDGGENLGRIRLLEDTDGDGRFDKSNVYADGLSWPTAITCYAGGIFVGAAPDIHYFKDTDNDGRADQHKIVFTGFNRSNVQGLINTFKWGLDNRVHGATSSSGASVRPGGDEKAKPLVLRGRDFAIEPRSMEMLPTSGGAQHGLSFNPWGDKFVCSNSNHIQFVAYEDRYVARNPYSAPLGPRLSIATDGPQADVFRISPVEPWRIVRTRLRKQKIVPGPVEGGGTAAGYFTGATGVTIYRGDAWPSEYYGWAVIGDVGSNLVHRKQLKPDGIAFSAHRVDKKTEFVSSTDIWFRPVQFANAPDGALYILDMYREVIEHPLSLHPVIKKHLDLTSGRSRGRIYRVVPEKYKQPKLSPLSTASSQQLVALLDSPNGWHRETASRLLYERADVRAIPHLEKLSKNANRPEGRLRALYSLDGLQGLTAQVILSSLEDKHPRVREHAVRLAERVASNSPEVREKLYSMVTDKTLRVRYQLAFTLGELNGLRRNQALATLAKSDGANGFVRMAVQSSLGEGAGEMLSLLSADKAFRQSKLGLDWLKGLAAQIGKQQSPDDVANIIKTLRSLPPQEKKPLQVIVQGLAAKKGSLLEQRIAAATGGRASEVIAKMLADARTTAADEKKKSDQRVAAIHLLRLGKFEDDYLILSDLLAPSEPKQVQESALAALASFDRPEVANLLLNSWSSFTPSLRARAGDALFSRKAWVSSLLDAVEKNRIPLSDLQPGRLKLLASGSDKQLQSRAKELLSKATLSHRGDIVADYQSVLKMQGNRTRGKAAFKKVCSACHRLEGVGHEIAPNLAAMRNRGPEAILLNVLDPNREVNPQYVTYTLITVDGRSLSGLISSETATSVTLKRADNATDTVLRIDIDEMRSTGISLMPEGVEKEIDKQAMADLLEYIKTVE